MRITTTRDNLLIGPVCYPIGAVVDVPEDVGRRLVEEQAATLAVEVPSEALNRPRRGRPPKLATSAAAGLAERAVEESPCDAR